MFFLDRLKLVCILRGCKSGRDFYLNDKKFGMLHGNHIRRLTRKRSVVTVFMKGAYVLNKKVFYADSRALVGSYLESMYT
jgi:hypothetical protein